MVPKAPPSGLERVQGWRRLFLLPKELVGIRVNRESREVFLVKSWADAEALPVLSVAVEESLESSLEANVW